MRRKALFAAIAMGAAVMTAGTPVMAAQFPVIAPVVSISQDRAGIPAGAAVLTSDGHVYTVRNPWEDTFPGDLWLCVRDDMGTDDARDDIIIPADCIGYEIPAGIPGLYEWRVWCGDHYESTYQAY